MSSLNGAWQVFVQHAHSGICQMQLIDNHHGASHHLSSHFYFFTIACIWEVWLKIHLQTVTHAKTSDIVQVQSIELQVAEKQQQ